VQTVVQFWSSRESNEILTEEKPGYYVCSGFSSTLQFCLLVSLPVFWKSKFSLLPSVLQDYSLLSSSLAFRPFSSDANMLLSQIIHLGSTPGISGRKRTVSSFQLFMQRFTLPLANGVFSGGRHYKIKNLYLEVKLISEQHSYLKIFFKITLFRFKPVGPETCFKRDF